MGLHPKPAMVKNRLVLTIGTIEEDSMNSIRIARILVTPMLGAVAFAPVTWAATLEEIQEPPLLPSSETHSPPTETPGTPLPSIDTPLPSLDTGPPSPAIPLPQMDLAPPAIDTPMPAPDSLPSLPVPIPEGNPEIPASPPIPSPRDQVPVG
jgi:hypothetical protein